MTAIQEPRNDLYYNYENGDAGWGNPYNNNFLNIGLQMHMAVDNQTTTVPPGSPIPGDTYIVGSGATGVWSGQDGKIAVWARVVGTGIPALSWIFLTPKAGWTAFDKSTNLLHMHNGTNWSTNGFLFTFV